MTAHVAFCHVYGITRLPLVAKGVEITSEPESDVDVIDEFRPNRFPRLLGVAGM